MENGRLRTKLFYYGNIRRGISILMIVCILIGSISFMPSYDASAASRGSLLTGNDKKVYDYISDLILSVSSGKCSDTTIDITRAMLFGKDISFFTAKDLGVSSIMSGYGMASDAQKAFEKKIMVNLDLVVNALLADFPYDLFWYDKTVGYTYSINSYNYDSDKIYLPDNVYSISLYVASAYSKTGKTGTTAADTKLISAAAKATANAAKIVSEASGKNDYEKLLYYGQKICDLVTYNSAAVSSGSTAYGDPWQLIYVFDGDKNTNVVCEGYSKAFKYLCDLTEFSSPLIECYLVSGKMSGGTGAGSHMWNIVVMDDGKTYMADITNCDDGSSGAGFTLFLRGCSTGSDSGYIINIPYREEGSFYYPATSISYQYGNETRSVFSSEELTIAKSDYEQGHAITVTPTPTATPTPTPKVTEAPVPTDEPKPSVTPTPVPDTNGDNISITEETTTSSDGTVVIKKTTVKNGVTTIDEEYRQTDGTTIISTTRYDKDGKVSVDGLYYNPDGSVVPFCASGQTEYALEYQYFVITGDLKLSLYKYRTSGTTALVPATVSIQGKKYSITGIGSEAFSKEYSPNLKKITIGKNVSLIGKNAFTGLKKLTTVIIYPNSLKTVKKGAFEGITKKLTIKIKGSSSKYKKIKKLITASGVSSKITFKRIK